VALAICIKGDAQASDVAEGGKEIKQLDDAPIRRGGGSLHKLHVHLRQQGFHSGLRFVRVAFAIAEDEREGFEMREGLQVRQADVGQADALERK